MKIILIILLIFGFESASCQIITKQSSDLDSLSEVFIDPEIPAEFLGGENEMYCFIDRTINKKLINSNMRKGRVIISLVIDTVGKLKDFKIVKSYSEQIDKEFLRVLKLMPNWKPGKLEAVTIEQKCIIPLGLPYDPILFCR